MKYHEYIKKTLILGGSLLFLLAICVSLWGMLAALGDSAGAQALFAVTLVLWICWCLDFVLLVVLLALVILAQDVPFREQGPKGIE